MRSALAMEAGPERRSGRLLLAYASLVVGIAAGMLLVYVAIALNNTQIAVADASKAGTLNARIADLEKEVAELSPYRAHIQALTKIVQRLEALEGEEEDSRNTLGTIKSSLDISMKSMRTGAKKSKKEVDREIARLKKESSDQVKSVKERLGEIEKERAALQEEILNKVNDMFGGQG